MQVFKTYFKILKQMYPVILVYTVIFFGIAFVASTSNPNAGEFNFEATKPKIVLINYDKKTPLINSFSEYMNKNTIIVDMPDEEEKLSDALFYRKVYYIIKIPKGFSESFMSDEAIELNIRKVPDSTTSIYIDSLIDKFFNTARLYVAGNVDQQVLSQNILKDLEKEVAIEIKPAEKNSSSITSAKLYYNFTNYVFFALIILIVGLIMQAFNNEDTKKRNLCSPLKLSKINFQLMLGNFMVTFGIWLVFVLGSIFLYGPTMFTVNGMLLLLNSFIFILSVLSVAFLIGNLIKNTEAQSAVANVVSLGTSFICGAFVPQMLLGESVLALGRIFPSYWYIKANDIIGSVTHFQTKHIEVIITCMLIEVGFAVMIYALTLIITKYKSRKAQFS